MESQVSRNKKTTKDIVLSGILCTLAILLSYIETFIPIPIPIPGFKLGFANIVIVVILYKYGLKYAMSVNIIRVILSALLFGNALSFIYAFISGVASVFAMYLLKKINKFSLITIAIMGALTHNIIQIVVAIIITKANSLISYAPFLIICSIISGSVVALLSSIILKKLKRID